MAAVTTAVVSAGATAYGAKQQSDAADAAARAQSRAAAQSMAQTEAERYRMRQDLQPYREAGASAFGEQEALLGLQGAEAQQAAYNRFTESPAQQFLREQGMRGLSSSQALRGVGGGEQLRELSRFNQGLASQSFDDYYNRLGGLSGMGYSAASGGAQLGAQNVAQQANIRQMGSQAQASGILGAQEARSQGIEAGLQALPYITGGIGSWWAGRNPSPGIAANVTDPNLYGNVA